MIVFWRLYLQTKGELSAERKDKYEAAQLSYQKLLQNATMMAVSFSGVSTKAVRFCLLVQLHHHKVPSDISQLKNYDVSFEILQYEILKSRARDQG